MSHAAEEILNGLDYFYCERFKARMPKKDCVKRRHQAIEVEIGNFAHDYDDFDLTLSLKDCLECPQGDEVYKEFLKLLRERRKARRARIKRPKIVKPRIQVGERGKIYLELGKKMRKTRQDLNISQDELGRRLGADQSIISKIEHNKPISGRTARTIEEGLESIEQGG